MPTRLEALALQTALDGLPGWTYDAGAGAISREFTFGDFSAAFGFMARVALAAQSADHHPDWSNSYNKVRIALSTHDVGGISENDIKLATAIDKLAP